jgi:capsule polysaccharide export protein KpsC/LpsZ
MCNYGAPAEVIGGDDLVPKHPQELPIGCEYLDAVIKTVCHIHMASAVTGHTMWIVELSLTTAFFPYYAGISIRSRVQNLGGKDI